MASPLDDNPLKDSPYMAPEPQQPMPGTDPMPARPSPFGGQPGYQFTQGPISHGGAIAGVVDNVLRGIVNGHAQGEQYKALKLKKQSDDLNASWQADSQRLTEIAHKQYMSTGKLDPNDPEFKQAQSALNGSWGALQQFRGQLIDQQGGGKKKGGKKQDAQRSPQDILTDPTSSPQDKMKALYGISGKLGDPTLLRIQSQYATPQAQQRWRQAQTQSQTEEVHGGNSLTHEQAQQTYDKYAGKTEEQMAALPQAEQDSYRNAKAILAPQPKASSVSKQYVSPDGKEHNYFVPGAEPDGWQAYNRPAASEQAPKVGTFGDFMISAFGKAPTPKQYEQGRAMWAKSGAGTTTGTHEIAVPQPDGSTKIIQVQTSSTKAFPTIEAPSTRQDGATPPPAAPSAGVTPSPTPAASTSSTPPSPTPSRRQKPARPNAVAPQTSPAASPPVPTPRAGIARPGDIVGGKQTPEEAKATEQADVLKTAFQSAIQRLKNPTPIGDQAIVFDWVRSQIAGAGRMTQTEIQQAYRAGSLDTRFKNAIDRATKGTLDPQFRRQMVSDIGESARAAAITAKETRSRNPANKPDKPVMPPKEVADSMKENQYAHGPDGATWQKKNGQLVLVGEK